MKFATTLYQFPLGLVVSALSIATLPTLARQASDRLEDFKQTLSEGVRLVLVLILPATAGLFALAVPIVALIFQHGEFVAADTTTTAQVLRFYLFGLPFAAVDQMLVFACYARKDTLRPALAGVISIVIYLAAAVLLLESLGLLSLMVADAVKHVVHTLLMIWILRRQIGGLAGYGILSTLAKSLTAAGLTAVAAAAVASLAPAGGTTLGARLIPVLAGGLAGLAVYILMVFVLDIRDARSLRGIFRRG
jgi:putative peptidoglycan lipid II flippase